MSPAVDRETSEQLLSYITGARWFAGKGRSAELVGVTPLPWLTESASLPAVRFEMVEIGYRLDPADQTADGSTTQEHELYQLAVCYRNAPKAELQHAEIGRFTDPELGPVVAYDAMQDPEACSLLVAMLLDEEHLVADDISVAFRLSSPGGLRADLDPQVFTGQQSNTSVMFGEVAMMKLFRRLELGRNLDIEVHDALSRSGVGDVAQLFGWVEAEWPQQLSGQPGRQPVHSDLAMVVAKLPSAEDGWGLALESLRHQDAAGYSDATSFTEDARGLGRALAKIHAALREHFPTASVRGAAVAEVMNARLDRAAAIAPALQPHLGGLRQAFDTLRTIELATQRLHGDFHLGQTLRTPQGWKIIDFEGEPVKTLAERSAPDSVWRDIAGMLRSFDYAAASVPGPRSQDWATDCRTAFLEGYAGGSLSVEDDRVLRAYEADKAVYEVVYEVRNRPEWVGIPLAAVATLSNTSEQATALEPTSITKE
ncbi:MAG: Trehalose synthase [uncultured Propionibacteriaceae bacterium]|uniref:Maltokinase n=1 Tax=uncultured Propionibacteriaceae bacterium TaxID=257457 RepID=A0A6J4PTB8_9ACTN|nr:MAG: Trehalose synthase [uncultured Propionibacteriaceae bacterium]